MLPGFMDALPKLDLLVVQDTFLTEVGKLAHVVLPTFTFAEKDGTYTSMERRVHLLRPAIGPKGEEEASWRVIYRIARRMGADGFDHEDTVKIFEELKDLVPGYGGLSYAKLQKGGVQWPCPSDDSPGTSVLYASPDRKFAFAPLKLEEPPAHRDAEYPLVLARGRVLLDSDGEMEVVDAGRRNAVRRDEVIELHPDDALRLGFSAEDWLEVIGRGERFKGVARLTGPQRGMVTATALFGQLATHLDASGKADPMMDVPGLPLMAVRVEKTSTPAVAADLAADD
jgi:predicted molibdopterin-dependent oxidoreductase YjgC